MRELLTHPSTSEFTQGSIFEGLKVNNDRSPTNAIVITARCDIANEKARNILCLPIYKAKNWLENQGEELVFRRIEEKLKNKLNIELGKLNISYEILPIYPTESILELVNKNANKKNTDEVKKLIFMFKEKKCDYTLDFVLNARKSLSSTLINNTENSIYFLEQTNLNEALEPYVVDLVNPTSIPFQLAKRLKKGITHLSDMDKQYLCMQGKEITYTAILKSPYIEHLLQKFSNFYSRIGTEDLEPESIEFLKEKLNEI
ncbi:hypothetical protein L9G74_08300 [Shewanella sp. C32]|uniref:Uncharacterized protein n=1 Tax=Shewanella electrica TaxID=515560 RepID=A0ABT2FJC7_9GAMM|nr:hypothetical protein [Shewanella electrica]MCH1924535.1 hypothetical protein [Shewanella electrica]MCS4556436.1 hypothetical protein [Shewanella electrica]